MNSRGVTRLSLLAAGLAFSATVALTPDIDAFSVVSAAPDTSNLLFVPGAREMIGQQGNGCERTRRPACNRPGHGPHIASMRRSDS